MNKPDNEVMKVITTIKEEYLKILDGKIAHAESVGSMLRSEGRYELASDRKTEQGR